MGVPISTTVPTPLADGVYPYDIPVQPGLPPAQQVHLVGKIGTGNWGPVNVPVFYNTLSQALFYWGASATLTSPTPSGNVNASLVAATQVMVPECQNFCDVRITDGTDLAATGVILDSTSATICNLIATYSGTDGNSITVTNTLISGSYSGASGTPMVQLSVAIANRKTWTSPVFPAGNSGGYVKGTYTANVQAVLNGSYNNSAPCPYLVYVSTSSASSHPAAAANTFSGGTSGIGFSGGGNGFWNAMIGAPGIGAPGGSGGSTGMYSLQGTGINMFVLCNMTNLNYASTMASFAQLNSCLALISLPAGTNTQNAQTYQQQYAASSPWLVLCNDFTEVQDVIDGTGPQYNAPAEKIAAGISQLEPYQYPGNKPYVGFQNFLGTVRNGLPYSNAELGMLESSGILIITNPIPRGSIWGLAHGMTSDGQTPISDTRMLNLIANELTAILGNFVGESQTPPPAPGQPDQDVTRNNARAAVSAYLTLLANPNSPQIAAWQQIMDGTNNTQATVAAGYLYDKILVTTLAGIRFILLGLSVGETVQVTTAS